MSRAVPQKPGRVAASLLGTTSLTNLSIAALAAHHQLVIVACASLATTIILTLGALSVLTESRLPREHR